MVETEARNHSRVDRDNRKGHQQVRTFVFNRVKLSRSHVRMSYFIDWAGTNEAIKLES
jgi:hypothetical protein